ncbi:hypothetical protein BS17DRAFT_777591 [Gyrodon lividus]|nr:hypothetical protein BS17DRAFT_777591 [Gyrodon lividus]
MAISDLSTSDYQVATGWVDILSSMCMWSVIIIHLSISPILLASYDPSRQPNARSGSFVVFFFFLESHDSTTQHSLYSRSIDGEMVSNLSANRALYV